MKSKWLTPGKLEQLALGLVLEDQPAGEGLEAGWVDPAEQRLRSELARQLLEAAQKAQAEKAAHPEARAAMRLGYAAAVTVEAHPAGGKAWRAGRLRVVPCPEQTRGVSCDDCRLCMDDGALRRRGAVIAFAMHGSAVGKRGRRMRAVKDISVGMRKTKRMTLQSAMDTAISASAMPSATSRLVS